MAVLVLVVSAGVLFRAVHTTSFHGDESGWITSGYYYTHLLLSGDTELQRWEGRSCASWGYLNMNLGKWLFGFPLVFRASREQPEFGAFYDFNTSLEENRRRGLVPPRQALETARMVAAAFGVLCCLALFAAGTLALNEWAGLLAVALTLSHRLFIVSTTRAMTDSAYLFFLLALVFFAVRFCQAERRSEVLKTSLGCGLCAGLACSIKITGLPLGAAVFGGCCLYRLVQGTLKMRLVALGGALALVTSLLVVYALNPYFWPIVAPRQVRAGLTSNTVSAAGAQSGLDWNSYRRFPRLFGKWKRYMDGQRAAGQSRWTGDRRIELHRSLLIRYGGIPGEVALVPVALLLVFYRAVWAKAGETVAWWPVAWFCLANYLLILLFLVHNWDRYYLPTVIAGRLVLAVAAVWLVSRPVCIPRIGAESPSA